MSPTYPTTKQSAKKDLNISNSGNKSCCRHCKKTYAKDVLRAHEAKCVSSRTCSWCKIVFSNQGNLASHTKYLHQYKKLRNINTQIEEVCGVCNKKFPSDLYLKYHNRREHYNLKTNIALRDSKRVNQVWFERVINSDVIVEMSKQEHNKLLIQKYGKSIEGIVIDDDYGNIDLTNMYRLQTVRLKCDICSKSVPRKSYKKHLDKNHRDREKKTSL